jgi:hypothetical protein
MPTKQVSAITLLFMCHQRARDECKASRGDQIALPVAGKDLNNLCLLTEESLGKR